LPLATFHKGNRRAEAQRRGVATCSSLRPKELRDYRGDHFIFEAEKHNRDLLRFTSAQDQQFALF
jgi:hypothetical protein